MVRAVSTSGEYRTIESGNSIRNEGAFDGWFYYWSQDDTEAWTFKRTDGQIAQTSLARMNGMIVRDDQGGTLAYHVLGDGASGEYLWDCLLDAMAEFDGAPVGLDAVRALAGAKGS